MAASNNGDIHGEPKPQNNIGGANADYYGDGNEVANYLRDPYHAYRVKIASEEIISTVPRGGLVGDLGAGSLAMATLLKSAGINTVVADVSESVVSNAKAEGYEAVFADVEEEFPWPDESFDGIFAGEVIEHVFDPLEFLKKCHKALKPEGSLVLTTPNLATIQDRIEFLVGKGPRHINPSHPYLRFHIRPFTPNRINEVLKGADFNPTKLRSNYWTLSVDDKRRLHSKTLAKYLPKLGGTLIVTAAKETKNH